MVWCGVVDLILLSKLPSVDHHLVDLPSLFVVESCLVSVRRNHELACGVNDETMVMSSASLTRFRFVQPELDSVTSFLTSHRSSNDHTDAANTGTTRIDFVRRKGDEEYTSDRKSR